MDELVPFVGGLLLGSLLGLVRPRMRLAFAVALSVVLGVVATVVTGEYRISWGFLLIDIPLAGCGAWISFAASRWLRLRDAEATPR